MSPRTVPSGTTAPEHQQLPLHAPAGLLVAPFVSKESVEVAVVPLSQVGRPRPFKATGDGVAAKAEPNGAPPQSICSMLAPSIRQCVGQGRPHVGFAKGVPPATKATVSSSFMAMRPNVSRISRAEANRSGLPLGPSGLT